MLDDLIGRWTVTCEPNGQHWDRIVALCFAGGEEFGVWMASQGYAVDCDRYKPSY